MKTATALLIALGCFGGLLQAGCSSGSDAAEDGEGATNVSPGGGPGGSGGGASGSGATAGGGGSSGSGGASDAGSWPGAAGEAGGGGSPGGSGGEPAGGGSAGTGGSDDPGGADPDCATGIINGDICCAASCGTCGGQGCSERPGGAAACCKGAIESSGVSCDDSAPPCMLTGQSGAGGAGGTAGSGGSGGSAGTGGTGGSGGSTTDPCDNPSLVWKTANKTNYESYPDPGSDECINYNGCLWAGQFAYCDGTKSEAWVEARNIVSVFPSNGLVRHNLCLRSGSKTILVTAIDTCADSDCSGCCTENRGDADRLIDIEKYTNERWGVEDGPIEWADLGENPAACD